LNQGFVHSYSFIPDEELVIRYKKKKDIGVLGELYKRYMYMVYGVCMKYLKNRDDSQDAVMQIFEVLVNDVVRFDIKNFKSWLFVVARNHCLMKLRKETRERNRHDALYQEKFMESTAIVHPLDEDNEDMQKDELQERLKYCLDRLKTEQRRCVEMFYYSHLCYREIAAEMNIEEQKVKSHIQNGKRNLKICIENKEAVKNV
jgi:RNA polymerase sigma-70 factor (ECF subfamily)